MGRPGTWTADQIGVILVERLDQPRARPWYHINYRLGHAKQSKAAETLLWKMTIGYPPWDQYTPPTELATARDGYDWYQAEVDLLELARASDKARNGPDPNNRRAVYVGRMAAVLRRSATQVDKKYSRIDARGRVGFGL